MKSRDQLAAMTCMTSKHIENGKSSQSGQTRAKLYDTKPTAQNLPRTEDFILAASSYKFMDPYPTPEQNVWSKALA